MWGPPRKMFFKIERIWRATYAAYALTKYLSEALFMQFGASFISSCAFCSLL
jgi:hypothetical protein